ncbi:MAG TPA: DUF1045 domain-containing protein [Verrucomicrobiae bacterium]|nr:DUF1045 domain-containing protein [Verrucomicrobiae bacterium]
MIPRAYDIALLPTARVTERAVSTSEKLREQAVRFTLHPTGPFPHLSLYMVSLSDRVIASVVERLSRIAQETPKLVLTATEYSQGRGYLSVAYGRLVTLDALQMTVITAVNPLRDGLMSDDAVRLQVSTGIQRENLERYGYVDVGSLFRPHVTLTRFELETVHAVSELPDLKQFTGVFSELGLFELGDSGTCVRKVSSMALSN